MMHEHKHVYIHMHTEMFKDLVAQSFISKDLLARQMVHTHAFGDTHMFKIFVPSFVNTHACQDTHISMNTNTCT